MLAIRIAEQIEIPVHIILPLAEKEFEADFDNFGSDIWAKAKSYIDHANDPTSS